MNSLALKIGAVLLFASGVVAFVAYRSGYFEHEPISDQKEKPTTGLMETKNDPIDDTTANIRKESLSTNIDSNEEKRPAIKTIDLDRQIMPSSKSAIIMKPEDFQMHSSKFAPIFEPRDLTPGPVQQTKDTNRNQESNANESINNAPGRQQMGGSKSIRMFNANDFKYNVADTSDQ